MRLCRAILCLLSVPVCALGQIVLTEADITPRIGDRLDFAIQSTETPLPADLDGVGEGRGPLTVDLTAGLLDPQLSMQARMDYLSPENTPAADDYPGADYAVRMTSEGEDPVYYYLTRSGSGGPGTGAQLLGISGGGDELAGLETALGGIEQNFPNQYPMAFGNELDTVEVPLDAFLPGMEADGGLTMTGSVDAWGTVQVPAGTFEALRLHVHGEAELSFVLPDGETLVLQETIEQFTWMARRVGTVATIQQITVTPVGDSTVPEFTISQVMLLSSFAGAESAVAALSWGDVKRLHAGKR